MSTPTGEPTSGPSVGGPGRGEIRLGETTLSKVVYWTEAGLHFFRSLEYDVIAADEDKLTAVRRFIEKSEDYAWFLSAGSGWIVDLQLATLIYRRLLDGYKSVARLRPPAGFLPAAKAAKPAGPDERDIARGQELAREIPDY